MIEIRETICALPWHAPRPLTDLPLIYHREHLFPYTSYDETAAQPVTREFRMVRLENEFLRVEVAPELGGRVYSLLDKRLGQEVLFRNPVVKPVRILPVWAFISGGIEFNFPIAHSPTSIAPVGCAFGTIGNYGFVRVGEREARTGMEWVVELGLLEGEPMLIQRTAFRNQTAADHPWMSWTICALLSTPETEFVHPPGRVLIHDRQLREVDWPGAGLNWDRNLKEMTALFWRAERSASFGAFHHDLGFGLMHLCDPQDLPGKKVWSYGHGPDRAWGQATTRDGSSYVELESGPLLDQAEKALFPSGTEKRFLEFWKPVRSRADFAAAELPRLELPPMHDPWLGWRHSPWQVEWEKFRAGDGPLPRNTVPVGLDLEVPLRRELARGNPAAVEPLALFLAFHLRPQDALAVLDHPSGPALRRLAGLIRWKALNDPQTAMRFLEAGPLGDPVAAAELDELYTELQLTSKRGSLLAGAPMHPLTIERRADLALVEGQPQETLRLLESTAWQRQHQRYARTALWQRARRALNLEDREPPAHLGEDRLAVFGAYWADT